jgi:type II secretory pathway component PulF
MAGSAVLLPAIATAQQSNELVNPITVPTFEAFLISLVAGVQIILVPIIVVFIIYAGFMYVTARGNPEAITRANKALLYAIIGGVIVAGAQAIIAIVSDTADSFKS